MQKKYWLVFWVLAILLLFFNNGNLLITDSVESVSYTHLTLPTNSLV
mgnify:CR=1 FL=1